MFIYMPAQFTQYIPTSPFEDQLTMIYELQILMDTVVYALA